MVEGVSPVIERAGIGSHYLHLARQSSTLPVFGFQRKYDALRFQKALQARLKKFGLTLNENKTRLIEFGRFAQPNRKERGEPKAETFTYLGVRPHLRQEEKRRRFMVKRITDAKRQRNKLQETKKILRQQMHPRPFSNGTMAKSKSSRLLQLPRDTRK